MAKEDLKDTFTTIQGFLNGERIRQARIKKQEEAEERLHEQAREVVLQLYQREARESRIITAGADKEILSVAEAVYKEQGLISGRHNQPERLSKTFGRFFIANLEFWTGINVEPLARTISGAIHRLSIDKRIHPS